MENTRNYDDLSNWTVDKTSITNRYKQLCNQTETDRTSPDQNWNQHNFYETPARQDWIKLAKELLQQTRHIYTNETITGSGQQTEEPQHKQTTQKLDKTKYSTNLDVKTDDCSITKLRD